MRNYALSCSNSPGRALTILNVLASMVVIDLVLLHCTRYTMCTDMYIAVSFLGRAYIVTTSRACIVTHDGVMIGLCSTLFVHRP